MAEFSNIQPPDPNKIRKPTGGSFAKRNSWLIVVVIAAIIIGAGMWFIIGKVKTLKSQYKVDKISFDTTKDQDSDDDVDSDDTTKIQVGNLKDSVFTETYSADIKSATLTIKAGASAFKLEDTTNQLFIADTKTRRGEYKFDSHRDGPDCEMVFAKKNTRKSNWSDNNSDSAVFRLNINPEWKINLDAAAAEVEFNLSKYKLRLLKVNGGAATFKIRIGEPLKTTDIEVSAGAADITIEIPKDAACSIETKSGLSSNTFDGFYKKDDSSYQTSNFNVNKNKIHISFTGGISDFKVKQY